MNKIMCHINYSHLTLNDMRKTICLKKTEVSVERISVCNVTEKLKEHGIPICHAPIHQ